MTEVSPILSVNNDIELVCECGHTKRYHNRMGLSENVIIGTNCNACRCSEFREDKYATKVLHDNQKSEAIVKDSEEYLRKSFVEFRQDIRQLIAECGIRSNPGWSEADIIYALRELLKDKIVKR